jgi:thioredoxin 1
MKATTKNSFATDVLGEKKVVLLDVWAPWCGPCRGMMPIIDAISEEIKDWAVVVKLDASEEMDLTEELGVSSLPTFLIYKNGQIVGSTIGAVAKTTLLDLLQKAK